MNCLAPHDERRLIADAVRGGLAAAIANAEVEGRVVMINSLHITVNLAQGGGARVIHAEAGATVTYDERRMP